MKGVELDPLFAADDSAKPLISKLLAVPALRVRYLAQVRDIADRKLDWKSLSAKITQYQNLITAHVKADTRNLSSYEAFEKGIAGESEPQAGPGRQEAISLKSFADQRRAYLLAYPEILKLPK